MLSDFFHGIFKGMLRYVGLCKIKPLSPEEEETLYWPFATRETYQKEKEANGEGIQAIVDGLANSAFAKSHLKW